MLFACIYIGVPPCDRHGDLQKCALDVIEAFEIIYSLLERNMNVSELYDDHNVGIIKLT